ASDELKEELKYGAERRREQARHDIAIAREFRSMLYDAITKEMQNAIKERLSATDPDSHMARVLEAYGKGAGEARDILERTYIEYSNELEERANSLTITLAPEKNPVTNDWEIGVKYRA